VQPVLFKTEKTKPKFKKPNESDIYLRIKYFSILQKYFNFFLVQIILATGL